MKNNSAIIEKASKFKYPHGFSTRLGGVSDGIFSSLNLGMNRGDDKEKVIKNWDLFLEACEIPEREFVCGCQVHKNNVHIASEADLRPAYGPGELIEADGYVTDKSLVPLSVFTADCVPILLEDSVNGVIGAVHSGWRSTVADIEGEAVKKMLSLGSDPVNIMVAIGPAIDRCCFEVGPEVIEAVESLIGVNETTSLYTAKENGKYMLDLRGVVFKRFTQLGVPSQNIELVGGCTMCNPDRYFSHRYTNGNRGSLACIISKPKI